MFFPHRLQRYRKPATASRVIGSEGPAMSVSGQSIEWTFNGKPCFSSKLKANQTSPSKYKVS